MFKPIFAISLLLGLLANLSAKQFSELLPQPGECGIVTSAKSILIHGGNVTKIDEYPWMALLEYNNGSIREFNCGGSLISTRYVVTAAHCIKSPLIPKGFNVTSVRLGEWDQNSDVDCNVTEYDEISCAPEILDIPVEHIIVHQNFTLATLRNDIALIRLARLIIYTKFVRPICLPLDPNLRKAIFDGVALTAIGWGDTKMGQKSPLKLKANIKGVNQDDCRKFFLNIDITMEVESTQMCAGGVEGVNVCHGDSGGPLIGIAETNTNSSYYFIAGVVSYGTFRCSRDGITAVYTRVGHFIDWIEENFKA